jgi:hypothetical protein
MKLYSCEASIRCEAERVGLKEAHEDDGCPYNTSSTLQSQESASEDRCMYRVRTSGNISRQLSHLPTQRSTDEIKEVTSEQIKLTT